MARIVIATPCQDQVAAGYALDLAKLVGHTTLAGGHELVLMQLKGTLLPQQRSTLVENAKAADASHLLWIDADMRFPKDGLLRLLAHDTAIVGANYSTRRPPILPTAQHAEHGHLFTTPDATGLVEVSHIGMGFLLTRMEVFATLSKPYFALGYSRSDDGWVGEDVFFCRQARQAGFVTFVDQDLSKEVRHLGEVPFAPEHACMTRDSMLSHGGA